MTMYCTELINEEEIDGMVTDGEPELMQRAKCSVE